MDLRVLAVAAPDCLEGNAKGSLAINSSDPASLYNACRYAGELAKNRVGAWGESNWAVSLESRQASCLLMYAWQNEAEYYKQLLLSLRVNLLLIGCMSICFPGAIECARMAREIFGDEVFIVLGGRHINETVYLDPQNLLQQHVASPLSLMQKNLIETNLFDLVISGDGEYIIAQVGELVAEHHRTKQPLSNLRQQLHSHTTVAGKWLCGWLDQNKIQYIASKQVPIDYNQLPSPCSIFGVRTKFNVFNNRYTAHVFSDTGRGCAYDCQFCSERRSVAGTLKQLGTAADRLFKQLCDADQMIFNSYGEKASAFVEDSLLLAGNKKEMEKLYDYLYAAKLDLIFGAQLTIDQILARKDVIEKLSKVGLKYFFIGLETFDPSLIGGMSKDVGNKSMSWVDRATEVFIFLSKHNIMCGAAVLFGLGETHQQRIQLLDQIAVWQKHYRMPWPVSMNWAVQHPLCGGDEGANYDYINWSTPSGPLFDLFHDFGESSFNYPLKKVGPPIYHEVKEIHHFFLELNKTYHLPHQMEAKF